jgi:hypothetical protein
MELNRCTSLSVQGINFTVYFFFFPSESCFSDVCATDGIGSY